MAKSDDELQFEVIDNGVFCDGLKISEYIKIVGLVKTLAEKSWKTRLEFNDMNGDKCLIELIMKNYRTLGI